jgi:dTDP-4-dehydrorhamnose reductase
MKIQILGTTGMLGSMVARVFRDAGVKFDEHNHGEFDARVPATCEVLAGYDWTINCIGRIKPTIDETDPKSVWGSICVNSDFPFILSMMGSKVIQIATDCVYDGSRGEYTESDLHNPTDVYGKTKSLGEVRADGFYNIRCSIIGPQPVKDPKKLSLFDWLLTQPEGASLQGYTNHLWNGVTTYHFAKLCLGIVKGKYKLPNVQHFVPADTVTKAALLKGIAGVWGRNDLKITETKAPTKADRSLRTDDEAMNGLLWGIAGYKSIPTIKQMLEELFNYEKESK